ncbi:epididymal protein 13 [Echinops telfairi]|uniref:Epididymal protein 13 n=1 Tax=Echinops telfairi TaxID=9371 RepID=A0AC55DA57_ECHTE|nr:epididymal protein 13 [Echinops telfairi]
MLRSEPFLKMSLLILLFPGLTETCIPREVAIEQKIADSSPQKHQEMGIKGTNCLGRKLGQKLNLSLKGGVGMMSRLSTDGPPKDTSSSGSSSLVPLGDKTQEESLLSLQVLNEETNDCKEGKPQVTEHPIKVLPKKKNSWNVLKCIYMMVTFLFVSYNKGDWCYCHYCNQDAEFRKDPCCSF